jgi:ABC-type multidrug transport system fused ATPase/permease subunit
MRKPLARSAAAGLSLTLVLVSLQPAVPAAAQALGAAVEGAAAHPSFSGVSAPGSFAPLQLPAASLGASLSISPSGPSLGALVAAPSAAAAAPLNSAVAASLNAVPAAAASVPAAQAASVFVPAARAAVPAAEAAVAPALSQAPSAAASVPAAKGVPSFVATPSERAAALPSASSIDGARFDGTGARAVRAFPAAATVENDGAASAEVAAAAPAASRRLARALLTPLRVAASPAVAAWTKSRGAVATIKENATWVKNFWSGLRADGVDVSKELKTASGMALVIAAVSLVPSWLYGQMATHLHDLQTLATSSGPWYAVPALHTFAWLSGALIVAHGMAALLTKFQSSTMYALGNKLMKGVSDLYVAKVLSLDMRWQNSRNVGDVVSTATDAIYTLQSTASAMIVDLVRNGAVALIAGAVMTFVSWKLSLFVIPFLIFVLSIPSSVYSKRVQDAYKGFFAMKKPKFASALQEIVVNMLKVKAAGLEDRELEKMREHSRLTYIVGGGEIADVAAPQRALAGGLTDVARVLVMAAAIGMVVAHLMPLSAAVTYIFLANFFRDAMQALTGLWVSLKSMRGAATRYDATMKQASENLNLDGKVLPATTRGRKIEMKGVKFRYTKDGAPILKGVDLTIEPGQMVGFVGMTGGGKTTTAMTVLGLYPLESGEIKIDGVPLSELNLRKFRREIGVSLQDSIPFAASVSDNIAYLRPSASEAEVWAAAKASGLHDQVVRFGADRALNAEGADKDDAALIAKLSASLAAVRAALTESVEGVPAAALDPKKGLKDNAIGASEATWEQFLAAAEKAGVLDDVARLGYRTRVGERGLNMSGGQKQRLMLAQIFIQPQNPFGVMIYDEPTSALDGRTQSLIEDQIAQRRGKTTQIVIAHRLSNVQRADRIVVFQDGMVAEQGTHDELMRLGGIYAKMWDAQRLLDAAAQQTAAQ